jgi:hypothetical protein
MSVCGSRKKFGLENVKFFFGKFAVSRNKTLTEGVMLSMKVRPAPCVFSSPRATYFRLSANLTDVGGRYVCGCGAVSRTLRRELRAKSSRRSGSSPWASPSPRAKTFALGEERLHRELEVWLSAKLLTHGEDSVSGSGIGRIQIQTFHLYLTTSF